MFPLFGWGREKLKVHKGRHYRQKQQVIFFATLHTHCVEGSKTAIIIIVKLNLLLVEMRVKTGLFQNQVQTFLREMNRCMNKTESCLMFRKNTFIHSNI